MKDLRRQLAATFRVLLALRDLSQSELARRAEMPSSQVNKYLQGETLPELPQVQRLASALEVELHTIFFTASRIDEIERKLEASAQPETLAEEADVILLREGGLLIRQPMGGLVTELNRLLLHIQDLELALTKRPKTPNR